VFGIPVIMFVIMRIWGYLACVAGKEGEPIEAKTN